ncbi:hypothetical protein B6U74_01175 [Candidatus Bathyarchaeota archaeon ex4484_205]|nr:MAG: hypothetical protein B6U74_01175 [Candidatus Bathyarchaeota archaeon ex4484_205]
MTNGRESYFTKRVLASILLCSAIITPAMIYYQLSFWLYLQFSVWLILILVAELARSYDKPLSPQEAFIITSFAPISILGYAGIGGAFYFVNLIYNHYYYPHVPILEEIGFADKLPQWFVIPSNYVKRTFLDPVWMVPIGASIIVFALGIIVTITTGIIAFSFLPEEELNFPTQTAVAEGLIAVVEPTVSKRKKILYASAFMAGFISLFVYFFPSVLPQLFPWKIFYAGLGNFAMIPWVDLNKYLEIIGFEGASFAIPLDLFMYGAGLVIPFKVALLMFIANFLVYFVGNHLLVKYGLWVGGIGGWQPGADTMYCVYWSQLRFWNSAGIGLAIALAVIPILRHPGFLINMFKGRRGSEMAVKLGLPSVKKCMFLYLFASIGLTTVIYLLAPSFPIWILILFMIGWPLIGTIIATRVAGITSTGFFIPMFNEALLVGINYKNLDMYLLSTSGLLQMNNISGAGFATSLKQAIVTGTSAKDYIKAFVVASVLSMVMGFIFTEIFWRSAPIPSAVYPATETQWPVQAMFRSLWLKYLLEGTLVIRPDWITNFFIIGAVSYLVSDFLGFGMLLPAMMGGFFNTPPVSLSILIGSFIGNVVIPRVMGKEKWSSYRSLIITGFSIGVSVILTLTASTLIVKNAIKTIPY